MRSRTKTILSTILSAMKCRYHHKLASLVFTFIVFQKLHQSHAFVSRFLKQTRRTVGGGSSLLERPTALHNHDEDDTQLDMNMLDNRPHDQRAKNNRPARRLNHAFKYLYRHDFHDVSNSSALEYLLRSGYRLEQVMQMNETFPPLLTLSVARHLHPKMMFLRDTIGLGGPDCSLKQIPPQFYGSRLEATIAPRHAFLVYHGLPHGQDLLQTYSSYKNETLLQEFLTACRKTKRFTALCHSWQRQFTSSKERISSKQIEAFDALFARGLMAASRDELVQWNNTWPLDYINITSACLINLLIEHGANPLERDRRGVSLLHWAAGTGNLEGLNQLLPHFVGGVWTQTERDSATPLHWAVAGAGTRSFGTGGHVLIAEFLLSQIGSLDLKCEFVNEVTRDGNSALMWAAWSGSLDCVKLLVSSQADIGVVNRNGCTLAHWATSGGSLQVCKYLHETTNCDFSTPNKGGNTPLTHAVAFGRADVVAWLRNEVLGNLIVDEEAAKLAKDFVVWTEGDVRRKQIFEMLM